MLEFCADGLVAQAYIYFSLLLVGPQILHPRANIPFAQLPAADWPNPKLVEDVAKTAVSVAKVYLFLVFV